MAVNEQTTWADTTEVLVKSGATRLKALEVQRHPDATAVIYVQLYNNLNPTPGVTTPNDVIQIGFGASEGDRVKVNFHGKYYDTGLSWFISSDAGATAPLTVELPLISRLFYI